jgi:hypothetical protein
MKSLFSILMLGARVVVASLIGLSLQLVMLVKQPEMLLQIQEKMKYAASTVFSSIEINSQYHVGYNFIGGDNIIVHTLFVLVAYIGILIILIPFKLFWRR